MKINIYLYVYIYNVHSESRTVIYLSGYYCENIEMLSINAFFQQVLEEFYGKEMSYSSHNT
jgi:hypothetical protein